MIEQEVAGTGKVVVVGHRGAKAHAPENTLVSFEVAAAHGADAVECDVRLTKDGEVVVIHDATVERVAGVKGLVAEMTFEELRRLDVGSHFGPEWAGSRIPLLDEVLEKAAVLGLEVVVETKGEPEPLEELIEKTVAIVRQHRMQDRTAIISFHHPSLLAVREIDDRIATGILYGHGTPDPIAEAREFRADSVRPHYARVTAELAEECHANGLCLHTWTVNDAALARRLIGLGVDSIGSDSPRMIKALVSEMGRVART